MTRPHTLEVIIYGRGTTPNDLHGDLNTCLDYCSQILGYRWIDERHRRRTRSDTTNPATPKTVLTSRKRSQRAGIWIERDWAQQQQTARRRVLDEIKERSEKYNQHIHLVVPVPDMICRNRKHIDELMEIIDEKCTVHFPFDATTLRDATDAARAALEIGAGLYTDGERVEHPEPASQGLHDPVELEFAPPDAPATGDADTPPSTTVTTSAAATSTETPTAANETASETSDTANASPGEERSDPVESDSETVPTAGGEFQFPIRITYEGGRPPKGFDLTDDGDELVSNDHYKTINLVIQQYRDGDLSQVQAAEKLDVSRATVGNLSERTDLYQLV